METGIDILRTPAQVAADDAAQAARAEWVREWLEDAESGGEWIRQQYAHCATCPPENDHMKRDHIDGGLCYYCGCRAFTPHS